MRRVPALLVLALAASSAAACASSSTTSSTTTSLPQVVAAENFWGNIAAQIGGGHIAVTSIITDPNADPHTYETDPKSASAFSNAQLVILNGAGYDDFASKLLSSSGKSTTVLRVDQLVGATGSNPNPHLWYSPTYVTEAATAIEKDLATLKPADAAGFAANLKTFLAAYQPYVTTLGKIKAKYDGTRIAYTERVPGYLVQAAGLELGTPATFAQSIEDGNDPSPGDTAAIDEAMKHHTVKVLLYNAQVTSPVTAKVQSLAKNAHIPVVGVAETIPSGYTTFQAWQIAQANAILSALGG